MESVAEEVERVKAIVGRFFPIYETRVRPEAMAFYVRIDPHFLDQNFEGLREELKNRSYIPILRDEGGEHILYVQRTPRARFRGPLLNLSLLGLTLASTVYAGMLLWASYDRAENLLTLSNAYNATIYFALPLMAILGTHEMGHYIVAKRHRVAASLPFFIPAPFTIIGTLGALISMREPIPNKKALLDIGIAGPLAGLAVAFPVTLMGLYMNSLDPRYVGPNVGGGLAVNLPFIYQMLLYVIPLPDNALLHPTAFAGWVGFLVTALNLLPAGQLDGGHIARALLGDKSKYLSYAAFLALLVMGFVFFFSWLLLAFFVLLIGLRHPPPLNDVSEIHVGRKALGLVVLVVLILSFVPEPLVQIPVDVDFEFRDWEDPTLAITTDELSLTDGYAVYSFLINNTGNVQIQIQLSFGPAVGNLAPGWEVMFTLVAGQDIRGGNATFFLNATESAAAIVLIKAPDNVTPGQSPIVDILAETIGEFSGVSAGLDVTVHT
ncbi:MAG: site-2 protease family protein [Thermoplasmata archaeon]